MHWHVGPWVWRSAPWPHWSAPLGAAGAIDLRTLPQMAARGGDPGLGLFWSPLRLGDDYALIGSGSWYDIKPNARERSAIPARAGYTLKGDDLVGLVLDALTDGADPLGLDAPRPLMPTVEGLLAIHAARSHYERFRWGRRHTSHVRDLLRADFAQMFSEVQAGRMPAGQHQRVLDFWCEKYGLRGDAWRELVPPSLLAAVPGRLPHQTTITESFNTSDGDTLGPDLSWTELTGDVDIVSNEGRTTNTTASIVRADSDLSGADHYVQGVFGLSSAFGSAGPICRKDSSATQTFYLSIITSVALELYKCLSGSFTQLATGGSAQSTGTDYTIRITANGSNVADARNGSATNSVTDTSIASGTRGGARLHANASGYAKIDAFEAADLAAGGILYTQLERGTRGFVRGGWTGGIN